MGETSKKVRATADNTAVRKAPGRSKMSSGIRELILSYSDSDPNRTWDADAFSRRVESRTYVKSV